MMPSSIPNPAVLDRIIDRGHPHLKPIATALRHHRCDFAFVSQGSGPFDFEPTGRPLITLIGDDLHRAIGPEGLCQSKCTGR